LFDVDKAYLLGVSCNGDQEHRAIETEALSLHYDEAEACDFH